MAGRRAQPIDLLVAKGKKHLTKAEIEHRKANEVHLGRTFLKCPDYIKQDPVALKKWRELMRDYKLAAAQDIELVKSSDAGVLAMYCKTFSEYQQLIKAHQRVSEIHYDCDELDELINDTDDNAKHFYSGKVRKQLSDLFSISAILTVEAAINSKMDRLIKMEDRLFLNPLAKIKNVPNKKKAEPEDPHRSMFGD